jgi:sucrose-6-phosphatase
MILLCCDLDRTVIPNGEPPEDPRGLPLLRALAARPEVVLAYASGRSRMLQEQAILHWDLPVPQWAIGDVGTSLFEVSAGWRPVESWSRAIASDWNGLEGPEVAGLIGDQDGLELQEPEQQARFKVSFYAELTVDPERLVAPVRRRLRERNVRASLIWSVDEAAGRGLLDVLPERATKLGAVRFLMNRLGCDERETLFAGDSGNDLPVLTSGLQAVLVANASAEVREQAVASVTAAGHRDRLYLARGGPLGLNGNYAAGVIEGLAHFRPEVLGWLEPAEEVP